MEMMGTIQNGVVILENAPPLTDGTRVRVTVESTDEDRRALRELLLRYAGTAEGLPEDMAEQHDHYAHGTAKR